MPLQEPLINTINNTNYTPTYNNSTQIRNNNLDYSKYNNSTSVNNNINNNNTDINTANSNNTSVTRSMYSYTYKF